ncbi:MAG TPA: bacillithiol biosynthesis cysteine-adding enzyme BshC [Vicinamibacterales bacterium]|jgi:bacillithiol biosynthesis cysteine-adding enzyme BshC|nr:bacillithiol biosynthesis cysteine-adding enzyme BshC [Vicinamibacterales bacterium]
MPRRLDSFPSALREYDTVSADSAAFAAPSEQSGRLSLTGVDVRRFPWIRPLAGDYAFDHQKIEALYAGNPAEPSAWRETIARAQRHRRDRSAMAAVLESQQEQRGAPPEARAAVTKLASDSTVAVVTGQQAGVFGGPLFTLLKAVTAIQLAQRTERELGTPAVAVFWVDAEDHDWEEVRSCTVLDAEFQPRTVTLADVEGAGERPVAALRLDERVEQNIAELASLLQPTEFSSSTIDSLRAAWKPGVGVARAFAIWLEQLLGPYGLVVFESSDPAAKPLVADVFQRELAHPGRTASLAADAGAALAARGHAPQVVPQADAVSLFSLESGRRPIRRQGDGLLIDDRAVAIDDIAREASEHPAAFSPNVLLRPIVQDTLLPTICYVAGPSELAYLGQLRGVYEHFGVPMPLMYPRATATLLDSGATRFLNKYGLPFEDLQAPDESALNRLLETQLPATVEQSLRDADEQVHRAIERVIDAVPSLDPTLQGAARTTLGKMEHELRSLHTKVIHAAKRRDETLRRQFTRAQAQAFPHGHPQERTLAVTYFLNKYGPGLVSLLIEDLPLEPGKHWLITL